MIAMNADIRPLEKVVGEAIKGLDATQEPMRSAYAQAAAFYLGFIRRRYLEASRGNGVWPDLSSKTKMARIRKNKSKHGIFKRKAAAIFARGGDEKGAGTMSKIAENLAGTMRFAILRDTSILFNSLSVGAPGSVSKIDATGIEVGTAIEYAAAHQNGVAGRLPQRKIMVEPDQVTRDRISTALANGVLKLMSDRLK